VSNSSEERFRDERLNSFSKEEFSSKHIIILEKYVVAAAAQNLRQ
jgi:hypothetical protein